MTSSRSILCALAAGLLLVGCARPTLTLQPGEKIILSDEARAAQARANFPEATDSQHNGRVVELKQPLELTSP